MGLPLIQAYFILLWQRLWTEWQFSLEVCSLTIASANIRNPVQFTIKLKLMIKKFVLEIHFVKVLVSY